MRWQIEVVRTPVSGHLDRYRWSATAIHDFKCGSKAHQVHFIIDNWTFERATSQRIELRLTLLKLVCFNQLRLNWMNRVVFNPDIDMEGLFGSE